MTNPTLRACPTCGVGYPLDALFCPSDGTPLAAPPAPMIGRTIAGRYQVTKELGRGGMGQVYLATQLPMKRPCALKIIRPDRDLDPSFLARFQREAENASRISHANVAQVYDSGEADGIAYLAMEFIDGEPLSAVLAREGRLAPRRTALIVWQVANALGAAHYLGIVHRDLKPENVMLTRYRDRPDFVKVVDFGIAKAPVESQQVTSASVIIGTPDYMSPEQFFGGEVDPRADVYALAVLTVRILAGQLPPILGTRALAQPAGLPDPAGLKQMPETSDWPEPVFQALSNALARDAKARTKTVDDFVRQFGAAISRWVPGDGNLEPWESGADLQSSEGPRLAGPTGTQSRRVRQWLAVGVGVVVLAASAAFLVRSRGPRPPQLGPHSPSVEPGPAVSPANPPDSPLVPGGSPDSIPVDPPTSATGVPWRPADSLARLDRLTDPSRGTSGSYQAAVAMYQRLAPRLTGAALGEAAYYAGRGLIRLGREAEACGLLRLAATNTKDSQLAEAVGVLLGGCPAR